MESVIEGIGPGELRPLDAGDHETPPSPAGGMGPAILALQYNISFGLGRKKKGKDALAEPLATPVGREDDIDAVASSAVRLIEYSLRCSR